MRSKFLLILGPSGVGKSEVIAELRVLDSRFEYISPFITRPLRPGEADKVSVSEAELDGLDAAGKLLFVNELYGVRYGTPRAPIVTALAESRFPVLDWPVSRLNAMASAFPDLLVRVYVEPPSIEALRERLGERGRRGRRYEAALEELAALRRNEFDAQLDLRIVNATGSADRCAGEIYDFYRSAVSSDGLGPALDSSERQL